MIRCMNDLPLPDWMEIAKLVLTAPNALGEADARLNRYDAGDLPLEGLMETLRALALPKGEQLRSRGVG